MGQRERQREEWRTEVGQLQAGLFEVLGLEAAFRARPVEPHKGVRGLDVAVEHAVGVQEARGPHDVLHKSVEDDPELYTMLYLSSAECCQHMFRDKVLAVSHRWDRPNEPDPTGAQMKASKRMLRANPQYEYMWLVRRRALSCACMS